MIPADGTSVGVEIPYEGAIQGGCCYAWEWAPDDSMVLGTPIGADGQQRQQVLVDVAAHAIRQAPWTSTSAAWQRIAP